MATEWPIKTIAECASNEPYSTQIGPFGKALTPEEYTESGVPLLRGVNVNHGRFHDDDFVFISEETANRLTKFESFPGDVLLVHKGTLGKIGLMPKNRRFHRYVMGNSMLRVRCNPDVVISEYLYYWLSSVNGTNYLLSRVSQVGVPQIQQPLTTLRECALPVPPLREQRAIAHVLGSLDDKIELNRRMNETLEAMARALFKSWFVDFDPVRAKADGRKPEGMDEATAKLFPDSFEESELGPIPQGWTVLPLRQLADLASGGTPSKKNAEYWNGEIPWVSPKSMNHIHVHDSEERVAESAIGNGTRLVPEGTVLVMVRGMGLHQGVRISQARRDVAFNQDVKALVSKSVGGTFLLYALLDLSDYLFSKVQASGHGTGVLPTDILDGLSFVVPPEKSLARLTSSLDSYNSLISALSLQNQTLATVRDSLLPKLLSGELRIKDAERFAEAAL